MEQYRLRITPGKQDSLIELALDIGRTIDKFCDGKLTKFSMFNYTSDGKIIAFKIFSDNLHKGIIDSVILDIGYESQRQPVCRQELTDLLRDFGGKEFFIEYHVPKINVTPGNVNENYDMIYCVPNLIDPDYARNTKKKYPTSEDRAIFDVTDVSYAIDPLDPSVKIRTVRKASTRNPSLEQKIDGFLMTSKRMEDESENNVGRAYTSSLDSADDKGRISIRVDAMSLMVRLPSKELNCLSRWNISLTEKRNRLLSNPLKSKINEYCVRNIFPYLETGEWRVSWDKGDQK